MLLIIILRLTLDLETYRIPPYLFECLYTIFCLCLCQIFYQISNVCTRQFLLHINVWTSHAGACRSQRGGTSVKSCELLHISITVHLSINSCANIPQGYLMDVASGEVLWISSACCKSSCIICIKVQFLKSMFSFSLEVTEQLLTFTYLLQ